MANIPDPLEQLLRGTRMGGDFGGQQPPTTPQPMSRKSKGCLWAVMVAALLLVFGGTFVAYYCDWLWFVHDGAQPEVFFKQMSVTVVLWVVGLIVASTALAWNLSKAVGVTPVFSRPPETPGEKMSADFLSLLSRRGKRLAVVVSIGLGMLFAQSLSQKAPLWMWSSGAVEFGKKDPLFGQDLGFFVFRLPWLQAVFGFVFGVLLVSLLLTGLVYFLLFSARQGSKAELTNSPLRIHLGVLGGLTMFALAAMQWVKRYDTASVTGSQFTGPGFSGVQALGVQQILVFLTVLVGVWIIINGFKGAPFQAYRFGVPGLVVFAIAGVGLYPVIIQRVYVEPNRLNVESPFAKRAIEMTRYSFRLDQMRVANFNVSAAPSEAEVAGAQSTLANMRLWDPSVLQSSIDGLQSIRPYYTFNDVDIDRYMINGKQTMVMLSPRDMDARGLTPSAQTWINTRLQYTHGYGLVMSPVNQATVTGQPIFLAKDFPPKMPAGLSLEQPRIYFSHFNPNSEEFRSYVLVNTKQQEFDFPGQTGTETYRWTGQRGVPVGGFLSRLMHSIKWSDGNLLVSSNITSDSRALYHRDIIERASKVYQFLTFDQDPYIVVTKGRLKWIIDAYTTTGKIPYSASIAWGGKQVNYARNSVKVVIDAYSGEMNAYAMDDQDPILKAYRNIYPQLFLSKDKFPAELIPHLRYGEDWFSAQAMILTQYHVTDPGSFLNNEDAWEIPTEIGRTGSSERLLPYYVQIRLPDEKRDSFMLILPFTPRQKNNMIGWMAAHCDPEKYGQTVLYKFPKDNQTPGPNQVESLINQNAVVAEINRQLNNEQSEIIPGNLLVIPIGTSILYVKPLFLQSRSSGIQPIPELKKVVLALRDEVVVADTYAEALDKLLGERSAAPEPEPDQAGGAKPPVPAPSQAMPMETVREALRLMDQAEAALKRGDLGAYGELNKQARERLKKLEQAAP